MTPTGIVRNVDNLGRIVLPKELRRQFGIEENTPMEIFVDGEKIVLRKYQPGCNYCNSLDGIKTFKGKNICDKCMRDIHRM